MPSLFVPAPALPTRTPRYPATSPRRRATPRAAAGGRSPWPFSRFVRTLVLYSPLGRLARRRGADPAVAVRARKAATAARRPVRGVVLVTGANGGTGRRVVRELLKRADGPAVRALTRSRERLVEALRSVGVDAEKEIAAGRLSVAVADLFNVRPEFFADVVAVASCSGSNVGPSRKEDPDRSKYFQGLKFYPPQVLDDTPENVEFVGIRNLVEGARKHFKEVEEKAALPVLMFDDEDVVRTQWGELDDIVMGGVSKSGISVRDGCLVLNGFVSTDNFGGFASARTLPLQKPIDLGGYSGLMLRVRGDGKSYKLIVRCEENWDGVAHCFTFPTKSGEWTDIKVPFAGFNTVFRAKTLPNGKPLDPRKIYAFQIMLSKFEYDGDLNPNFAPGPFELRIESLKAYKADEEPVVPKIVHLGSAAVTRVLRKDEFEELPPIVQLNEELGRLLEWKLAGEDVIRQSGVPYCILRSCALTEKEPLGLDSVRFAQGDTIIGQISRDDIAHLIVNALSNPDLVNVTTEVSWKPEDDGELAPSKERIAGLRQDAMDSRSFASFPFIPAVLQK